MTGEGAILGMYLFTVEDHLAAQAYQTVGSCSENLSTQLNVRRDWPGQRFQLTSTVQEHLRGSLQGTTRLGGTNK